MSISNFSAKQSVLTMITVGFIGLCTLPAFNYYVDIARIFHSDGKQYVKPQLRRLNQRTTRMSYAKDHLNKYNKYIAGSSRISSLPIQLFPDGWHMLLQYDYSRPIEHINNLLYLKKFHKLPKQLLLGLEEIPLYEGPPEIDYFTRTFPSTWSGWLEFYKFYAFRIPTSQDFMFFKNGILSDSGKSDGPNFPKIIKPLEPGKALFLPPGSVNFAEAKTQLPWLIREVMQIKNLVDTQVFVTPRHYKTLIYRNFDDLFLYNFLLAQVTDFIDFRFLDFDMILNNNMWRETHHFRTYLAAEMARRFFDDGISFGKLITKENIVSQFRAFVHSIQLRLPHLLKTDKMMLVHRTLLDREPLFKISRPIIINNKRKTKGEDKFVAFNIPATESTTTAIVKIEATVPQPLQFNLINYSDGNRNVIYTRKLETVKSERKIRKQYQPFLFHGRWKQEFYIPLSGKHLVDLAKGNLALEFERYNGQYRILDVSIWNLRNWAPPVVDTAMQDFCLSLDTLLSSGRYPDSDFWSLLSKSRNMRKIPMPNAFMRTGQDSPEFFTKQFNTPKDKDIIVMLEMDVEKITPVKVMYRSNHESYSNAKSCTGTIHPADKDQRMFLRIPKNTSNGKLLFRIGGQQDRYIIRNIEVRAVW